MNRAACDNALLASCYELHGNVIRVASVGLLGAGIGVFWYIVVALRAGAL